MHSSQHMPHQTGRRLHNFSAGPGTLPEEVLLEIQSGHVDNCVNLAVSTPATHMMTVRHVDKVGVLAAVLDEVRQAEWNVQEMENLIFDGAQAACARIRYTGSADNYVIDRIASNADVLAVSIIEV